MERDASTIDEDFYKRELVINERRRLLTKARKGLVKGLTAKCNRDLLDLFDDLTTT